MKTEHNRLLDGMRGLAALAVVLFHAGPIVGKSVGSSGYLAVDFFFALSGYVIALNYESRLRSNLPFRRFLLMRIVRLYPLFVVGAWLGIAWFIAQAITGRGGDLTTGRWLLAAALNVFMLPVFYDHGSIFPLNPPAWSLSVEMIINIIFAAVLFSRSIPILTVVVVIGCGVITSAAVGGAVTSLDIGWSTSTFGYALARVAFSFVAGMLIARIKYVTPRRTWIALFLPIILILCLMTTLTGDGRLIFDLTFCFVISPGIILIGSRYVAPTSADPALKWSGEISYALYILHFPLLAAFGFAAEKAHLGSIAKLTVMVGGCLIAAQAATILDTRVRDYISKRLKMPKSAPSPLL